VKRAARCAFAAAVAVSVAGVAATAHAWEPVAGTHELAPRWSGPLIYQVNERGSDDLDIDALLAEVHAGMSEWTTPDCTGATTRYDGLTPELSADNVIAWRESDWSDGAEAVAVTATSFVENGSGVPEIVAATMRLNGQHWTWVTGASASEERTINTFSVILHEGGHYWGLGHTQVPMSVMNLEYSKDLSGLAPDDIEGICSLYPKGQVDPAPPDCDAGPCVDSPGSCVVDRDCASDDERCVAGRCMSLSAPRPAMCMRDAQCDAGERCEAGVCVEHEPTQPARLPVGSDCDMDDDCESGLCRFDGATSQCTALCEADEDCGRRARCMRDGAQAGLCGESEPAKTERAAESGGGCSAVASSAPTKLMWLLLPFMLYRMRRLRAQRT
jgi:hypothetical protein